MSPKCNFKGPMNGRVFFSPKHETVSHVFVLVSDFLCGSNQYVETFWGNLMGTLSCGIYSLYRVLPWAQNATLKNLRMAVLSAVPNTKPSKFRVWVRAFRRAIDRFSRAFLRGICDLSRFSGLYCVRDRSHRRIRYGPAIRVKALPAGYWVAVFRRPSAQLPYLNLYII
jgi:hypothetical protein